MLWAAWPGKGLQFTFACEHAPVRVQYDPIKHRHLLFIIFDNRWDKIRCMKKNHIARFEEIVQRLVEGTSARLFAGRLQPLEVANALARALEDHAVLRPNDLPQAPNHYWVALNPADHDALFGQQPDLVDDLASQLFDLAHQAGFALTQPPEVSLTSQEDVPLHQVRVSARWIPPGGETTVGGGDSTRQMMLPTDLAPVEEQEQTTRPFLIVEGQRHVDLLNPTVSLGRSLENDIIIDDARVSRRHAQLRRRYGRYVIFDLGSTGGTAVNGYPVQECVLDAGDVISLAGVELIYGEDAPTLPPLSRGTSGTPALHRSSPSETAQFPSAPVDPSEI